MWLGCVGPSPAAHDGYTGSPPHYGYAPPRGMSPLPSRSKVSDSPLTSQRQRGQSYSTFDSALEETRWPSGKLNEAPQWQPSAMEMERLQRQLFDLQVAEHGAVLRAHMNEQHVLAEARAAEHHASMQASQDIASMEQRAAAQLQRAVAQETQRATDLQRYYEARLAATNSEAAACAADANMRRQEGPRLEALAAAAAQRLSNSKIIEADRRTAEASAARECCERLVLKQLGELQESAAANAELVAAKEHASQRLHNIEELNARLSHRLMDAEEANAELKYRLRQSEESHKQFLDSLRRADPALVAEINGEAVSPEGPQRTAATLEAENSILRTNLLVTTEKLEDLVTEKESLEVELQEAQATRANSRTSTKSPRPGSQTPRMNVGRGGPRSLSPRQGRGGSPRQFLLGGFGGAGVGGRNASPRADRGRISARLSPGNSANSSARTGGSARSLDVRQMVEAAGAARAAAATWK